MYTTCLGESTVVGRAEEAGEREGGRGGEWVWAPAGRAGEAAEVRRLQVHPQPSNLDPQPWILDPTTYS